MTAYLKSMLRLKKKGLLTDAMINKAITLGRINEQQAQEIRNS